MSDNIMTKSPISDQQTVIDLLRNDPRKNTRRFLVIQKNTAWVEIEVCERERGISQSTNRYLVNLELAQSLVKADIVVQKWYPTEYGGERLELKTN